MYKAVQNEQLLQVELLCIYGANPALPNNKGQTAEDVAREVAQKTGDDTIYERLVEIRHELPDRLTFFVARKVEKRQMVLLLKMDLLEAES